MSFERKRVRRLVYVFFAVVFPISRAGSLVWAASMASESIEFVSGRQRAVIPARRLPMVFNVHGIMAISGGNLSSGQGNRFKQIESGGSGF
ncbi:hypothetical protein ABGN05_29270 [Aquibium sp. LZ166]|uniref:Secreted protein n=1 Tax=Aquibium pacificus TaxID=3153579 RepID=A0ABV3STT4_9HYPH